MSRKINIGDLVKWKNENSSNNIPMPFYITKNKLYKIEKLTPHYQGEYSIWFINDSNVLDYCHESWFELDIKQTRKTKLIKLDESR